MALMNSKIHATVWYKVENIIERMIIIPDFISTLENDINVFISEMKVNNRSMPTPIQITRDAFFNFIII